MATKTFAQLQKQIAELQHEAAAVRAKEMVGVIESIRDAIGHYHLTVEHLFGVKPAEVAPPGKARAVGGQAAAKKTAAGRSSAKGRKVPVKYRDELGNTWTGRGSRPRWLRAAIEDGMSVEDFAVK